MVVLKKNWLPIACMRKRALALLCVAATGCTRHPVPSVHELAQKFTSNPTAFQQLGQLIREDTGRRDCFVVGLDNIGDYWEYDGEWTHRADPQKKLGLSQVLRAVGLSQARYETYRRAFTESGSERVAFCPVWNDGPWVSVLVYRAGLAVSGCSGSIDWRESIPGPKGKRGNGDFTEIAPLRDGWYVELSCT